MTVTAQQIATVLEVDVKFVTDVVVNQHGFGKTVDFNLNDVAYFAKLSRGKFLEKNMRRNQW